MDRIEGIRTAKTKLGAKKFEQLLASAKKVFGDKGFFAASIADICNDASTAVGTFYIYFDDKIALYRYMVNEYMQEINATIANAAEGQTQQKTQAMVKAYVQYLCLNTDCLKIIWGCMAVDEKLLHRYYTNLAQQFVQHCTTHQDDTQASNLAYALMGIVNFCALRNITDEIDITQVEQIAIRLTSLLDTQPTLNR